jgi:hypothetical protein
MNKNRFLIQLSESDKIKFGSDDFDFASQSPPQQIFSAVWLVEAEVNNGGFSQYFVNSSAETAAFVVDALETIGAPRTAAICKLAIAAAFPGGLPKTPGAIRSAAAEFSEEALSKFEPLDQEFFAYPHNLTDLLYAYVYEHPVDFGTVPKP